MVLRTIQEDTSNAPYAEILRLQDGMHIRVYDTPFHVASAAADFIANEARRKPTLRITFATGETMKPVYKLLAGIVHASEVDFSRATGCQLDEYIPANPDTDEYSFVRYLRTRVVEPLRIGTFHEINGLTLNAVEEARRYGELLGPSIDLAILGIGPWSNETRTGCHIGFNESGTPFWRGMHFTHLDITTQQRDQRERHTGSPNFAITQGISDILRANKKLLVVTGGEKSESIFQALYGPIGSRRPASALRLVGPSVTVLLDREAAAKLPL